MGGGESDLRIYIGTMPVKFVSRLFVFATDEITF